MQKPSWRDISEATGIGQSYASMVLSGARTPPRNLAIEMYRKLGWRHDSIAELTDEQMLVLEQVEPWVAPQERAA